jgi:hypothetical protein
MEPSSAGVPPDPAAVDGSRSSRRFPLFFGPERAETIFRGPNRTESGSCYLIEIKERFFDP